MTDKYVTGRRVKTVLSLGVVAIGLLFLAACADSGAKDPADAAHDRQNQLLSNPMAAPNMEDPDISGGGIGDYHNQSMKKDLDDVLN
jgi:hypothetical protein